MRDIKFRAWDKRIKSMFLVREMFWLVGGVAVDDGASIEKGFAPEDFEIMQYTGLKDKNGKEIYEGDIVSYGLYNQEVEWQEFEGADGELVAGYDFASPSTNSIEVIGNVWENPELLKEANG